jgi:hypothetical protein
MKTAIYCEDGARVRVQVLEDDWVDDVREVTLLCIETIQPSPIFGAIEPDALFDVSERRGYEGLCWSLELES